MRKLLHQLGRIYARNPADLAIADKYRDRASLSGFRRLRAPRPKGLFVLEYRMRNARADLIFFHGGGAVDGEPAMLGWMGQALARVGIRVLLPAYRVLFRDHSSIDDAVSDARAMTQFLRARCPKGRPALIGGASMGGFLALNAIRSPDADRFDGLVLVNPVTNTGPGGFRNRQITDPGRPDISPLSFASDLPRLPSITLHPPDDQVAPFAQSAAFHDRWANPAAQLTAWPETGGHGCFGLAEHRQGFADHLATWHEATDFRAP